ncbi:hypothetical protein HPB49_007092 [Dermacentor silvarum]|uniref:Uncharacterized protein n=1 Tax=Dermacentor silvarum TaxID=543639 RepID=A0ACB8DWX3_DERSI|nr:hypothetical protein HPB49_007092 [Dermacentor silvarum]
MQKGEEKEVAGGHRADGLSEAKRMRLDDSGQYVCDKDSHSTTEHVASVEQMSKEDVWKEEERKLSNLSCNRSNLEPEHGFKKPDATSPRRPAPSLKTHSPTNSEVIPVCPVGRNMPASHNLPPEGPIVRTVLDTSSKVLATHNFPLGVFYKACIIDVKNANDAVSEPIYRVRFSTPKSRARTFRWCHRREMAYAEQATDILPVGTRVVASFSDESMRIRQALYAGLIAEPPEPSNRNRYLVFFDDGYTQYVDTDKVFAMCGSSRDVWEDMHGDMRGFVRSYLEKYPEIPMLRLYKGRKIFAEWHGSWWRAQVLTVDSNLVEILYEADNCTEWIYRGSMRLSLFNMALNQSVQNTAAAVGCIPHDNLVPVTRDEQHVEDMQTKVPVTCVNSIDNMYPTFFEYSSKRHPGNGVELNLDRDFLCGCDCEDDCQDREKCSCQQLTIAATEALKTGRNPNAGYHYRRLLEPHLAGVYECNSWCHCSRRCYNRVVQNGLRARLQVFKTKKCGWGIRCLDDLPQGTFICIYSGQLLNEQAANELMQYTPAFVEDINVDINFTDGGGDFLPLPAGAGGRNTAAGPSSSWRSPDVSQQLHPSRGCSRSRGGAVAASATILDEVPMDVQPGAKPTKRRALANPAKDEDADFKTQVKDTLAEIKNALKAVVQSIAALNSRITKVEADQVKVVHSAEATPVKDGNQNGDEYLADLNHIEVVEKQKDGYESDVVPASDDDTDKSVENLGYQVSASNLNCELDYLQVFFTDQLIEEMVRKTNRCACEKISSAGILLKYFIWKDWEDVPLEELKPS